MVTRVLDRTLRQANQSLREKVRRLEAECTKLARRVDTADTLRNAYLGQLLGQPLRESVRLSREVTS